MANSYSKNDILDFLSHAGDIGLIPLATATALSVAVRNVFGVLTDAEQSNLEGIDLQTVVRRFNSKRSRDFNPSSLKEYGRRVYRAFDLFLAWRADSANFSVKTRSTKAARKLGSDAKSVSQAGEHNYASGLSGARSQDGGYESSIPIRPDRVVTIVNIPTNLTRGEAERLSKFITLLAVD